MRCTGEHAPVWFCVGIFAGNYRRRASRPPKPSAFVHGAGSRKDMRNLAAALQDRPNTEYTIYEALTADSALSRYHLYI